MEELGQRSWEYQFEFAAEMARRCTQSMGDDKYMHQALDVYEDWYPTPQDPFPQILASFCLNLLCVCNTD